MSQQPWGPQQDQPYAQPEARPLMRRRGYIALLAAGLVLAVGMPLGAWIYTRDDDSKQAEPDTAAKGRTFTDLSQDDQIYVSVITKNFPALAGDPGTVAADGHRVCAQLDAGTAPDSIKAELRGKYGAAAGEQMVTSAVVQFCGEHQINLIHG